MLPCRKARIASGLVTDDDGRMKLQGSGSVANVLPVPDQARLHADLARVHNLVTTGAPLSPASLKISGLDANCNRTAGYSIFDLPPAFERAADSNGAAGANVSGSLNTEYNVDGGLAKGRAESCGRAAVLATSRKSCRLAMRLAAAQAP